MSIKQTVANIIAYFLPKGKASMPHDIIDNRTRELAPEINNFLADSIRAHFAVGCRSTRSLEAEGS
jgi:hypothetical protein